MRPAPLIGDRFVAILLVTGFSADVRSPQLSQPAVQVPTLYHGTDEKAQAQAASYADLPGGRSFRTCPAGANPDSAEAKL